MGPTTSYPTYSIPGFADPFSALTHLGAAGVFFVLSIWLFRGAVPGAVNRASLGVYCFSLLFLLSMSGVYHLLSPGAGRYVMQHLDHAAIFVLIAGTFTPIHTILFRGFARWGMLLLIWVTAITGITFKMIFFGSMSEALGSLLYLGMGWIGLISGTLLARRYGFGFIRPLLWGALAYTVGAAVELAGMPVLIAGVVGPHELFHVAVLFGAGWHWVFVYRVSRRGAAVEPAADAFGAGDNRLLVQEAGPKATEGTRRPQRGFRAQ
jgi:channel protein (hemolysin III family)